MELTSSSSTWPWPSSALVLTTTLSLCLLFFLRGMKKNNKKSQQGRLPPGPSTLVFLARFLLLRRSVFHLAPLLRDLHARYGPVVSVHLFRTVVFVSDRGLAHRALVQGGATFADRPSLAEPLRLLTGGARDISTSPYGPYWRLLRRNLAAQALSPARVAGFAPARQRALDALLRDLRASADDGVVRVRPAFRRAMVGLLVHMCFGATAALGPDALSEVMELQQRIVRAMASFPVFSFFPALTKRVFRRRWAAHVAVRRRQEELFLPLIHARRQLLREDAQEPPPAPCACYVDSLLGLRLPEDHEDGGGGRPLTDGEVVTLCSEFLNAGTDTTVTLLEWAMAELVNHQDVQTKIYNETLSKLSRDGHLDDLQGMAYLKAVVLESLRLHPPGHFLVPHGVLGHGGGAEIGGYAVPNGSEVNFLAGDWGLDEAEWAAPREFRPARFLDGGEAHGMDVTASRGGIRMVPFGAGRRICPAYTVGLLHVEFFVANLVREMEWLPPAEREGKGVDLAEEIEFTAVMKHPLRARVVPRNRMSRNFEI
ncbi:hypothetical protein BRADI_4g41660v3 [Brachypodium distachyon]|uniref:Cytochrome P450 n=2 Tax=Brachypodium distachyon TaxID=15368 RepID=A0A2K2CTP2_BRADI|nr:hypothetical protein BRADI_4g41660v3 [Brachypodium distachyon]